MVAGLAAPVTVGGTGTQTVQLGTQPAGTNAIDISFTCLTAGRFAFADGAGLACERATSPRCDRTWSIMPVIPGQDSTTITATARARWRLTATYATVKTSPWGVNASGQTSGTPNQHGTPDLVAAIATNGRSGYVYADQLSPPLPKNPTQAVGEDGAPPRALTVYESDGETPIGAFVAGG